MGKNKGEPAYDYRLVLKIALILLGVIGFCISEMYRELKVEIGKVDARVYGLTERVAGVEARLR